MKHKDITIALFSALMLFIASAKQYIKEWFVDLAVSHKALIVVILLWVITMALGVVIVPAMMEWQQYLIER